MVLVVPNSLIPRAAISAVAMSKTPSAAQPSRLIPSKRRTPEELQTADEAKRRKSAARIIGIIKGAKDLTELAKEIPADPEGAVRWEICRRPCRV